MCYTTVVMATIVIVSGYFNPLHRGHIRMIQHARQLGDKVLAIVNNDVAQQLKKGKIIMSEDERAEVVGALRYVDEVMIAIDQDRTVIRTLEKIVQTHVGDNFIFANGGDATPHIVPETEVCERYGIDMRFGIGGDDKPQSSSNINRALGHE